MTWGAQPPVLCSTIVEAQGDPTAWREAGDHPSRRHALWKARMAHRPPFPLLQFLVGIRCGVRTAGWRGGRPYPRSSLCNQGPAAPSRGHCAERNTCRATQQKSCKPWGFILTQCLIRKTSSLLYEEINQNPGTRTEYNPTLSTQIRGVGPNEPRA